VAEIPLPARFRIVRRLGEGGIGIVYEALDVDRGVHVALWRG
jgi:serine/threonine protein kinase